jgi:hypothetical protein
MATSVAEKTHLPSQSFLVINVPLPHTLLLM